MFSVKELNRRSKEVFMLKTRIGSMAIVICPQLHSMRFLGISLVPENTGGGNRLLEVPLRYAQIRAV